MAIAATDIRLYATTLTGGKSLGGPVGAAINCGISENLFERYDGNLAAGTGANVAHYRCLYVVNTHPSLTAYGVTVAWATTPHAAALDTNPTSALPGASLTVANQTTAPAGLTFTLGPAALTVGDLPAGQCKAVWLRRAEGNAAPSVAVVATVSLTFRTDP